jgi:hypothetical protein
MNSAAVLAIVSDFQERLLDSPSRGQCRAAGHDELRGASNIPKEALWCMDVSGMHQVRPSAALSAPRRAMSVNGLNRHSTAPAASTLWRSASSLSAVMKIIGVSG